MEPCYLLLLPDELLQWIIEWADHPQSLHDLRATCKRLAFLTADLIKRGRFAGRCYESSCTENYIGLSHNFVAFNKGFACGVISAGTNKIRLFPEQIDFYWSVEVRYDKQGDVVEIWGGSLLKEWAYIKGGIMYAISSGRHYLVGDFNKKKGYFWQLFQKYSGNPYRAAVLTVLASEAHPKK